jgi:hypothetical protein
MADDSVNATNPYQAPRADTSAPTPPPASALTREEVAAFVGDRRSDYFWGKWKPVMDSGSLFAGFSWPAGFFNVLWFLYRKMYREFAIVFVILLAVGELTSLVSLEKALDRVINFVGIAVVGSIGVGLYLRRARRVIAAARLAEPDLERRLALLRRKGGTSVLWPLLVAALLIAAIVFGAAYQ